MPMSAETRSDGTVAPVGYWEGHFLRRATRGDVAAALVLLLLAIATVAAGRKAASSLAPSSADAAAGMLDELDMPSRLPDAPLVDPSGQSISLYQRIAGTTAVVTFYAPWCEPCQRELPHLVRRLGALTTVIVVVGADEDIVDSRNKIDNLGLKLVPLVDATGQLGREAKVSALPTTFLISREGVVQMGVRGYSWLALFRMKERLGPDDTSSSSFEEP